MPPMVPLLRGINNVAPRQLIPIQQKVRMVMILRMSNNGTKEEKSVPPTMLEIVSSCSRDKLLTPSESALGSSDCEESHPNDHLPIVKD